MRANNGGLNIVLATRKFSAHYVGGLSIFMRIARRPDREIRDVYPKLSRARICRFDRLRGRGQRASDPSATDREVGSTDIAYNMAMLAI